MDATVRYVAEWNIHRFLDLLEREEDPVQRDLWTRLLVAEEDRFGKLSEKLEVAQNCLNSCADRIANQRRRVEEMAPDHPHRQIAETLLDNMIAIRGSVRDYHALIKQQLDP